MNHCRSGRLTLAFLTTTMLFTGLLRAQQSSADSSVPNADELSRPWIVIEVGHHTSGGSNEELTEGFYRRMSIDIPIWQFLTLPLYVDQWNSQLTHTGFGAGLSIKAINHRQVSASLGFLINIEEGNAGIIFPVTAAVPLLNSHFRLQGTAAYRASAQLSPASHNSYSFFYYLIGVGYQI